MRKIILIGHNETARTNINTHPNICLLARYIKNGPENIAVVFKDKYGNISLTQVDPGTACSFLVLEAKFMQGPYTIDVITDESHKRKDYIAMITNICDFIKNELGEILNSKGIAGIRHTKTGTVMIDKDKLNTPEEKHIDEFFQENKENFRSKGNPLASYNLDAGARPQFLRFYERAYDIEKGYRNSLPILIFNNGKWTGKYNELDENTRELMQKYHQEYPERFPASDRITKNEHFAYASEELHELTVKYLSLKDKTRYSNLFQFFSTSPRIMIPEIIRLITDYAKEKKQIQI
jgi:hypothetical protein